MAEQSIMEEPSFNEGYAPKVMENREFVAFEEEDIQKLNRSEAAKFGQNPRMKQIMAQVEAELGNPGRWEEHWLTVDASGRRVYARVYYTDEQGLAIVSDGRIIRKFEYPPDEERTLH